MGNKYENFGSCSQSRPLKAPAAQSPPAALPPAAALRQEEEQQQLDVRHRGQTPGRGETAS